MFAKAEILAVETTPLNQPFQGIIFRENVRQYDVEGLEMLECFRPNDIIKARVVSLQGAGNQSSTLLSTTEDELGVVFAMSEASGQLMIPRSWKELQCVKTKKIEKRKVAKPEGIE